MKPYLFALAALVLISGCSSVNVTRDYDPAFDFSQLKTYAWKHAQQPVTGNPRVDNDLIDARIRSAINSELTSKGFELTGAADADMLLAYFVEYKSSLSGSTLSLGFGTGRFWSYGGAGYSTEISEHEEGILTIDVIHAATRKTIWRGVGTRMAYESSEPVKISEKMNHTVLRILSGFPPDKK